MENPVKLWLPVAAVAACMGSATPAAAQFTATVVPPPRAKQPAAEAARPLGAPRADSAAAARLSDLRAWVDSAAGAIAAEPAADSQPDSETDSKPASEPVGDAADTGMVTGLTSHSVAAAQRETQDFRNAAPAPATASPLPLLALLGLGSLLLGITVRRW